MKVDQIQDDVIIEDSTRINDSNYYNSITNNKVNNKTVNKKGGKWSHLSEEEKYNLISYTEPIEIKDFPNIPYRTIFLVRFVFIRHIFYCVVDYFLPIKV